MALIVSMCGIFIRALQQTTITHKCTTILWSVKRRKKATSYIVHTLHYTCGYVYDELHDNLCVHALNESIRRCFFIHLSIHYYYYTYAFFGAEWKVAGFFFIIKILILKVKYQK